MKLGVSILPEDAPITEYINVAKKFNFKGFSVRRSDIEQFGSSKALIEYLNANEVEAIQIFCWEFDTLNPTEKGHKCIMKCLDFSSEAKKEGMFCPVIIAAGGHNGFSGDKRDWKRETRIKIAENIKKYARIAEKLGAYIVLEPSLLFVTSDADATKDLFDLINSKNVFLSLDLFNYSSVHDAWDSRDLLEELISKLKNRICQIHLKDIRMDTCGFRGKTVSPAYIKIYECHAGEGNMDYVHILKNIDRVLSKSNWAIIEHTPTHRIKKSLDYIMNKANEAGVIFD